MASLRARADHQAAVARRLDVLTAELAADLEGEPDPAAGHTRVRPLRVVPATEPSTPVEVAQAPPAAPLVPVPGRHADRRVAGSLLPEAVRGRVALGPGQLAVVAILVAVGVLVTGWWLVRGDPHQVVAPPAPVPAAGSASPLADITPVAGSSAPTPAGEVTVDVTGKVRRPGIVVLDTGARVVDAVAAAGGARRGVDLSSLNLARVLVDGEQIVVGGPAPVAGAAAAPGAAPGVAGAPVNLNTATEAELEGLPDVGPVTAQAILAWRDEHGRFTSVDELLEVDGIGDATLAKIAPHATV